MLLEEWTPAGDIQTMVVMSAESTHRLGALTVVRHSPLTIVHAHKALILSHFDPW